ncbi:MAG TPA: exodeoxyribonuclease III [Pseudobdellovibrionaceae bacterium]|nr:exodeoxyribonuclease III [Pseudobdellovibrionaceae bacterium]
MKNLKLITWNVNGIRACYKKNLMDFVRTEQPDIICLQETKAHLEQVEPEVQGLGFPNFYWSSAEKKGYSGVATFCQHEPTSVARGMGIKEYDREGRFVITEHEKFTLFNIYFPNGGSGDERHQFKQRFLADLYDHLKALLLQGKQLIVVGDYNVAHREMDVYDPVRLSKESGFLPEERAWFDRFLQLGFIDCFRHFHPDEKDRYSWWSYRELARISNRGWRIDYVCVSKGLEKNLVKAEILDDIEGSDHCPVLVELTQ